MQLMLYVFSLRNPKPDSCCNCFLLWTFKFSLHQICKSTLSYFLYCNCVYNVRYKSYFNSSHTDIQLVQYQLFKSFLFPHWIILVPLLKIICTGLTKKFFQVSPQQHMEKLEWTVWPPQYMCKSISWVTSLNSLFIYL